MSDKYFRKIIKTPLNIINEDGSYNIGVFDVYFKNLNFRDNKRPLLRKFMNNQLLTEWQAVEVLLEDIFLIAAVFKFSLMNKSLLLVYDRKKSKLYDFSSQSSLKYKSYVSSSLENKSTSERKTQNSLIKITNELNNSKLWLEGYFNNQDHELEFNFEFDIDAKPSNVVIPMTEKNIVYTEKDFLKPKGYLKLNDEEYIANNDDLAILDDHRGYYPLSSGYDWITCLTNVEINNEKSKFALNLTDFYKNRDPKNYNENGYWYNGDFIHLPIVHFTRKNDTWIIKDVSDRIDLTFKNIHFITQKNDTIFKIDYMLSFGEISGYIKTENNGTIKLNKDFALGEKRVTQLFNKKIYDESGEKMIIKK